MRSLLAAVFAIFSLTAAASEATSPKTIEAHHPYLSIPLWVDPVGTKMAMTDLAAFVNNRPVPITKLLTPDSDLVILMVLDLTGDLALVEPAKQSLVAELNRLPANVWVGLLHAQGGLAVLADPTADRASISELIQSLPISGKAGLLDTVEPTATLADDMLHKADVRAAVLYVTDSDVTNYQEDLTNPVINSSDPHDLSRRFPDSLIRERESRLERQLARSSAPLFILHLQYRPSGLNQSYQSALSSLAESTGGFAAFCRSSGNIPQEMASMVSYLRSSYFVKLAMPQRLSPALQLRFEWKNEATAQPHLAYRARILVKQR